MDRPPCQENCNGHDHSPPNGWNIAECPGGVGVCELQVVDWEWQGIGNVYGVAAGFFNPKQGFVNLSFGGLRFPRAIRDECIPLRRRIRRIGSGQHAEMLGASLSTEQVTPVYRVESGNPATVRELRTPRNRLQRKVFR